MGVERVGTPVTNPIGLNCVFGYDQLTPGKNPQQPNIHEHNIIKH